MRKLDEAYNEGLEGFDPHPAAKDYYDTLMDNLNTAKVKKYLNTEEGKIAVAVRETAEKNLMDGGSSSAGAAAPKSDAKK